MIIYKDIVTGDELISDTFDLKEVDGIVYEADCREFLPGVETFELAGANPSIDPIVLKAEAEAAASAGKETDDSDTPAQIIDLVDNFRLRRQWKDVKDPKIKKSFYLDHLKKYMKAVVEALKHKGADEETIRKFQSGATRYYKKITANIKDYDFYAGESLEGEGMLVLMNYREDGLTPYATLWKHGLTEMKV